LAAERSEADPALMTAAGDKDFITVLVKPMEERPNLFFDVLVRS